MWSISENHFVNIRNIFNSCGSVLPLSCRAQLIKDISKLGGKILSTVPVDGNESRDEVEVDEKSGRAARKGPIYVVSHPREFRKPNYLMALATGMFCAFAVDVWWCSLLPIGNFC